MFSVFKIQFTGVLNYSADQSISIPEVKAGDIISVYRTNGVDSKGTDFNTYFRQVVQSDGFIEQLRGHDLTTFDFEALVIRVS